MFLYPCCFNYENAILITVTNNYHHMKHLLSKINTKTNRSIIAGLGLAMILMAGSSLAQQFTIPSPVPLVEWIGQNEEIVDRNGSLTIGDVVTPAWMKNPDAAGFPDCILDENANEIRTESCLDVSGGASFANLFVRRAAYLTGITAIGGSTALGSATFPSATDARFVVQDIAGTRDSILVTGLAYYDDSNLFAPRNLTTQRAVCARQDGTLFACTQGEVIDNPVSYDWVIGDWGACTNDDAPGGSFKTRTVICQDSLGNNHPDSVCLDNGVGRKPATTSTAGCSVAVSCGLANNATYSSSPTTELCASGTASPVVDSGPFSPPRYRWSCSDGSNSIACSATYTAPDTDTSYSWDVSEWGLCSNGVQTRFVLCRDSDNNIVSDSFCSNQKPASSRPCSTGGGNTNDGYAFVCGSNPNRNAGPGQTYPNADWTRGSAYQINGSGDYSPFSLGARDCSGAVSVDAVDVLLNQSNAIQTTAGNGQALLYQFFCVEDIPPACACAIQGNNEEIC